MNNISLNVTSYEEFYFVTKKHDLFKDNTIAKDFSNFLEKNIQAKNNPSANFIINGKYEYVVSQITKEMFKNKINIKFINNGILLKEVNFLQ